MGGLVEGEQVISDKSHTQANTHTHIHTKTECEQTRGGGAKSSSLEEWGEAQLGLDRDTC